MKTDDFWITFPGYRRFVICVRLLETKIWQRKERKASRAALKTDLFQNKKAFFNDSVLTLLVMTFHVVVLALVMCGVDVSSLLWWCAELMCRPCSGDVRSWCVVLALVMCGVDVSSLLWWCAELMCRPCSGDVRSWCVVLALVMCGVGLSYFLFTLL